MDARKTKTVKPLFSSSFGSANSLGKAPKNPKYDGVRGKLKTGSTAKNVKPKIDSTYDLFKRIGRTTLSDLLAMHSSNQESVYDLNPSDVLSVTTVADDDERKLRDNLVDTDFLLLDVREKEEYDDCHIEGARNFPAINLRRDQYPPIVYSFKSKPNTIVILYVDDDSKHGIEAATLMTEKGFDNIYLLTGGMKSFGKKFPNWLQGLPPPEWKIKQAPLGLSPTSPYGTGRLSPRTSLKKSKGIPPSPVNSASSPYNGSYNQRRF